MLHEAMVTRSPIRFGWRSSLVTTPPPCHSGPSAQRAAAGWERLGGPIVTDGPRHPPNQLLAIGGHPLCLACRALRRLVGHHIHRRLFTGCSVARLEELQNCPIILDNHSTILSSGASIITTARGRTCLAAPCHERWTFLQGESSVERGSIRVQPSFAVPLMAGSKGVSSSPTRNTITGPREHCLQITRSDQK
jgi:hypothetical protein